MPTKAEMYAQMAEKVAVQLTGSWQEWAGFLTTAARLYKYPFHEQLMIYAQRPDATACAEYDLWNDRMGRYVRRGSKGIALVDDSGDRPRLRYVFDISDTGTREHSRTPWLWQLEERHIGPLSAMLERNYDVSSNDLAQQLADVAAKLAEAEGGEAASAAADRDDREGLLLLSQEMNDTCRAMLKCEKLKARFRVDCASLQSEPAELDSYGVVVLTGLTNEALAKLALGLCDTPYTRLAAQAILAGKRVYIPTEEVELYRYASTAPAAYYAMMKERLDLLLTSGVVVCSKHNLEGLLLGGAACEAAPAEAPAAAEPSAPAPMPAAREEKLVHVTKRVLTERDIRDAAAEKVTCIHVPAKCILTALAKDCAKEHGIRLVQE